MTAQTSAVPSAKNLPSTAFMQELSAFGQRHGIARTFGDTELESYIDQKFGETLINIDSLPPAVRQFIEQQNRVAGRNVGRSGLDSFHAEDADAALGPETTAQRIKRENRALWFRKLLELMLAYTGLFEDTYRMLRNAKQASKRSRKEIEDNFKLVKKAHKEVNKAIQDTKKPGSFVATQTSLKNKEARLKQELEDLNEYEEKVLKPAEKKLNGEPLSSDQLQDIQDDIKERMPGRGWRIFESIMNSMSSEFFSFPRMDRITTEDSEESEKPENTEPPPQPVHLALNPTSEDSDSSNKKKKKKEGEESETGSEEDNEPELP